MTRAETGAIEAAILDALYRRPSTIAELAVALHRDGVVPPYWSAPNVRAVVRRLYERGALARLAFPTVTRSVLWWAS